MRLHVAVAAWSHDGRPSGAARRTTMLLREVALLLAPGEQITVLHGRTAPPPDLPAPIRLQPVDFPTSPTWRRALAERRHLGRLLDDIGATMLDLGTLPVPRHLPCPTVLTLHDLRDLGPFRRRPAFVARHVLRRSLGRASVVVVPSAATAVALREAVPDLPPVSVVHNGVDDRFFAARSDRPFERPYFLHVGHLEPRKNLLMLLSAFAQVLERWQVAHPNDDPPRLVLAGADAGHLAALRERAAILDLTGHVDFPGVVDEERIVALYGGALAVLVPSHEEGFGLCALEGMAAGRVVLAADRGALPEVVDDGGILLPADDAGAWASVMTELLERPTQFGEQSLRAVARAHDLSWRAAAQRMLGVWRGV
jgi:glycosyltransferase involved in cell wall biosynthesis